MTDARTCPSCGLINPGGAERCDCGYDFATSSLQKSYLPPGSRRAGMMRWRAQTVGAAIGALIGSVLYSARWAGSYPALFCGVLAGLGGIVGALFDRLDTRAGSRKKIGS